MTDERKTASIEFRATPSAKARWQEAAGGPRKLSAWLTDLANEASRLEVRPNGGDVQLSPKVVEQEASAGQCPRWMHHRSGVYCGTCKKVN